MAAKEKAELTIMENKILKKSGQPNIMIFI
jgi:hypothetical protein